MSTQTLPRSGAETSNLAARIAGFPIALLAAVAARRRWRHELAVLSAMDNRMLADIGLTRGDIERAMRDGQPWRNVD